MLPGPGPANSHEDMPSGSSEIIGRDQLGSKFKPLVIKVLGSFKSSNLSLNGKVEKLRRVLISESPSIIRSHFESKTFDVHARHLIHQHEKIRSTAMATTPSTATADTSTAVVTTTSIANVEVTTRTTLFSTSSDVFSTETSASVLDHSA